MNYWYYSKLYVISTVYKMRGTLAHNNDTWNILNFSFQVEYTSFARNLNLFSFIAQIFCYC